MSAPFVAHLDQDPGPMEGLDKRGQLVLAPPIAAGEVLVTDWHRDHGGYAVLMTPEGPDEACPWAFFHLSSGGEPWYESGICDPARWEVFGHMEAEHYAGKLGVWEAYQVALHGPGALAGDKAALKALMAAKEARIREWAVRAIGGAPGALGMAQERVEPLPLDRGAFPEARPISSLKAKW